MAGSALVGEFGAAGLALRETVSFAQPVAAGLREFHARLVSQPQSKFRVLSEAEFAEGLDRLAADAEAQVGDEPVFERCDVMVLSR